jgi:hypothetical protein
MAMEILEDDCKAGMFCHIPTASNRVRWVRRQLARSHAGEGVM